MATYSHIQEEMNSVQPSKRTMKQLNKECFKPLATRTRRVLEMWESVLKMKIGEMKK